MSSFSKETGPVSHEEARDAVIRLVNSHFHNKGEHGRFSIPANPKRDDDLRLMAYIEQQEEREAGVRVVEVEDE